jgi:hypothetical protein
MKMDRTQLLKSEKGSDPVIANTPWAIADCAMANTSTLATQAATILCMRFMIFPLNRTINTH